MAWTKHEQSPPANTRYAVYSEVAVDVQSKTLDITTDLGTGYVIKPTLIEIHYTAIGVSGTRALELTVTRDSVEVFTMVLDSAAHPLLSEEKWIYLYPRYGGAAEAELSTNSNQHGHIMPPLVLGQGDVMLIRAASGFQGTDDMELFVHAEVLSGINPLD